MKQQRGQQHRHYRLRDEYDRGDLDRGSGLQRGHLAERGDRRGGGGGKPPGERHEQVAAGKVVGGELRGDAAPCEGEPRPEHRHRGGRAPHAQQHVGQEARQREQREHDRERGPARVRVAARGRAQPRPDDAEHDRADRQVLARAGALAEHALADNHQHRQAQRQRRLHDNQGCEAEGHHLQGPAEHRQGGAAQPAHTPNQAQRERHTQVLLLGGLARVHRLQRKPEAE